MDVVPTTFGRGKRPASLAMASDRKSEDGEPCSPLRFVTRLPQRGPHLVGASRLLGRVGQFNYYRRHSWTRKSRLTRDARYVLVAGESLRFPEANPLGGRATGVPVAVSFSPPVSVVADKLVLAIVLAGAAGRMMPKRYNMCSRVVTLLLLPAFLLSQWAVACRCPGGCRAAGHDARPHVHVHDLIPGQTPKKCRCCQHADPEPALDLDAGGTPDAEASDAPDQGDDGVVYLSASVVFAPRFVTGVETADVLHDLVDSAGRVCLLHHGPDQLALPTHTPPARRPAPRPIYILTLSLLI